MYDRYKLLDYEWRMKNVYIFKLYSICFFIYIFSFKFILWITVYKTNIILV